MMSDPSLYDELEELTCPITGNKYIHNLETLPEKVTSQAVKKVLTFYGCHWDCNLENRLPRARKIIAILVLIGRSRTIEELLSEELTDEDLPLSQNGAYLHSDSSKKIFKSFRTWEWPAIIDFMEKQWVVIEPSVKVDASRNLPLESHCALSMLFSSCVKITTDKPSTAHVYKAALRPESQHKFADSVSLLRLPPHTSTTADLNSQTSARNPGPVYVALKTFIRDQTPVEDFVKERDILNRIISKGIKNNHLIKHLFSCDKIPCIIFPWADGGDLVDFWQRKCQRAPGDFLWSLRQIAGLAHALVDLHDRLNCRHGDLKPANILCFNEKGVDVLKIADVGVSRIHSLATGLREGVTITSRSTEVYQGPEFKSQTPRSRRYDCWSMGCIILEFIVWLLYDFQALQSFLHARNSNSCGYYLSTFISGSRNTGQWEKAVVHPVVKEAMDFLREDPRCGGTALEALVDLVDKKLLKIDPAERLIAAGLHDRIQKILKDVDENPSYMAKVDEHPPAIPPIFNLPPLPLSPVFTSQDTS
jgi:serine/threonine protein kinase